MFKRFAFSYVLPILIVSFYTLCKWTWRIRIYESEGLKAALKSGEPIVFSHWHGDVPGLMFLLHHYRAVPMISNSTDGELIASVVALLGVKTARGSSRKGGQIALNTMVDLFSAGFRPAIAVDGPKGPRHKAKYGILELSRVLQAKVVPLTVASDRFHCFHKAWDKMCFPKPFARIQVVFGEPVLAVAMDEDSRAPVYTERLETAMHTAGKLAHDTIATGRVI